MSFEILEDVEFEAKPREYKGNAGPRPRSEEQLKWDAAFETAWNRDSKTLAVQILPDEAENARKRVNSSARYFEKAVTEGKSRPGHEKGTVILTWKLRVPKRREKSRTDVDIPAETSGE